MPLFRNAAYLNPKRYGYKFEIDMGLENTASTSGTGATILIAAKPGYAEVFTINAGTTTTGTAFNRYDKIEVAGGIVSIRWGVEINALSTVDEEYIADVGLMDGTATSATTDGNYFRYDRLTSVNWLCVTESGGTETATDSGVAVTGDPMDLRVELNAGNTSTTFYIDDVLVATNTTNISSAVDMTINASITKSAGTLNRKYFGLYYEVFIDRG